ncbi:MAG TPA: LptF/LptG family permease [Candidatus Didemnitutus sp.]|nr:LptF/LptG family permease [Candidatus Didemnitutus sp.]
MKLLHRYIFVSVAFTSFAAVGVLAFVFMIGNLLRDLLGWVIAGQIPPDIFLRLVGESIVVGITYALPMGILTGVLLVLGRMSADCEITAIRGSGVSVAGISAPIFFFALLCAGLSLAVNFYYMPRAKVAYETELHDAIRSDPSRFIVPKTFIRDFPGKVIYVGEKKGNQVSDFWGWELDHQGRVLHAVRARSGKVVYDENRNMLVLTLYNVVGETHDAKDPENASRVQSGATGDQATIDISLESITGNSQVRVKLKWRTFDQLIAEWRRLGQPDPKTAPGQRYRERIQVQTTIQEKFATAFSVLSFALVAIPLGIKVSRKETSANLGIALVLAMGYYIATVAVNACDMHPDWRPDLLMWVPNIGFQTLGAWMFYKVDR